VEICSEPRRHLEGGDESTFKRRTRCALVRRNRDAATTAFSCRCLTAAFSVATAWASAVASARRTSIALHGFDSKIDMHTR
jgi:hypothetical protein